MSKTDSLGAFEEMVLLAVAHCGEDAYGMTVRREIESRAGRSVNIGAVYSTLDRLEKKGFVESRIAKPGEERRSLARRYFTLLATGARALSNSWRMHNQMWAGVDLSEWVSDAETSR